MDITTLRAAATVACFATFVAILAWAFARRNRAAFDEAAQLPFDGDAAPAAGLQPNPGNELP